MTPNAKPANAPAPVESSKDAHCLMRHVAEAFAKDPSLEAITLDRTAGTLSVATMGRMPGTELADRLRASLVAAESSNDTARCPLLESSGDCLDCPTPISPGQEKSFRIERKGSELTIARVTCPTSPKFWKWRKFPWPRVVQRDVEFLEHAGRLDEWKPQLAAATLCGMLGLAGFFLREQGTTSLACYGLAYAAGAWFTAQEAWERLRERAIDVHFLMLAVAAGSASIGAWGEGAMLLFLFSLSGALEHFALGRTQKEIHALFKDAPKSATILDERGAEREVPVELLRPGQRLLIKPGAQFPVDAEVVRGETAADESNLTGEAAPVEKRVGDSVFAGTINLWGAVEATVLRPAAESALQKIIRLIKDAQHQKAPAQQFADKFGSAYTYAVLLLSLIMFFVWWIGFGLAPFSSRAGSPSAFYKTMTLLVVASPCALVLSIPSAVLAAIAAGARRGVLFRGGAAVEKLAQIHLVALDKTGTLTTGELQVDRVESFPAGREFEVAELAFSLERLSTHPLARAITRHGKQRQFKPVEFEHFESMTGLGLQARLRDQTYRLGRREWIAQNVGDARLASVPSTEVGLSEVWLSGDGLLGRVVLRDDIRPQARAVLDELRHAGLRSMVLTGDRRAAAEHLKAQLQLDDVRAELKPEEKVAAIHALSETGQLVAMIGDGVNDAPSLAAAHVGVAMGARGSDAALEQADVVLMKDRLENFLVAFRLSQRARRIIRQNLVVSLGTVAVLVSFAIAGRIPLTVGVVGHEGSTVIVVMNSLRLLLRRDKALPEPVS